MDDLNIQIAQARTKYETYLHELQQLVDEADQLRLKLFQVLKDALNKLEGRLRYRPGKPTSSYWKQYEDYWQAFLLFKERLTQTYGLFHQEHFIPSPFDRTPDDSELDDYIDEIEDTLDSYRLRRNQQQDLLTIIELLDSIERLRALKIPEPPRDAGKEIYTTLTKAKSDVKKIGQDIWQPLSELGVVKIKLSLGEYPPPETTRILARRDSGRDDNVIIDEIIANGYFWKSKLLRKADVVVITQQGSN